MLADSGGRQLPAESRLPAVRAQITVQFFSRSQNVTPQRVPDVYITVYSLLPEDPATTVVCVLAGRDASPDKIVVQIL